MNVCLHSRYTYSFCIIKSCGMNCLILHLLIQNINKKESLLILLWRDFKGVLFRALNFVFFIFFTFNFWTCHFQRFSGVNHFRFCVIKKKRIWKGKNISSICKIDYVKKKKTSLLAVDFPTHYRGVVKTQLLLYPTAPVQLTSHISVGVTYHNRAN